MMFPAEDKLGEGSPVPCPTPGQAVPQYLLCGTGADSRRAHLLAACCRHGDQRLRCGSTCGGRECRGLNYISQGMRVGECAGYSRDSGRASPALRGLLGEAHAANKEKLSMVLGALRDIIE